MTYSRENPSKRYEELKNLYRKMHTEGAIHHNLTPEETFPGDNLKFQAQKIKYLIDVTNSEDILDYGSGKGLLYETRPVIIENKEYPSIQEYWDIGEIYCYDPSYDPFSELPDEKYDGVIATDVLEHCPKEDMEWIVEEIFSYANKFVYATIASYPAKKTLPNGENAHCTIETTDWWVNLFTKIYNKHPGVAFDVRIIREKTSDSGEIKRTEETLRNF